MDGVMVVGATNLPWKLDSAVLRRFQRRIYVPLPNERERAEIFKLYVTDHHCVKDDEFELLSKMTVDYSGSDIKEVANSAMMQVIGELDCKGEPRLVNFNDLKFVINKTKPATTKEYTEKLEKYVAENVK